MKFKTVEVDGKKAVLINDKGNPIVINDDNEEIGIDAIHLFRKVPDLTNQVKQYKENVAKYKAVFDKLKPTGFDSSDEDKLSEWIEKITTNQSTVDNLDEKQAKTADQIEQIKKAAQDEMQQKIKDQEMKYTALLNASKEKLDAEINSNAEMMIRNAFANSKYLKDNVHMHPDVAMPYFQNYFKVESEEETGKRMLIGYYKDGTKVLDPDNTFEVAGFDEALKRIIMKDPHRDTYLNATANTGTGGHNHSSRSGITNNPFSKETFSFTEQNKIMLENPKLGKQLQAEAKT